ncbi:tail fiber assembly protein [Pseudomonas costantinii]|nr:phage tail assembly chaperone [Pseudomonas costantinii]
MKIFYSAKDNTFFNEVFHGTRDIQVQDPQWVRPTVSVPDPEWNRPNVSIQNPAWSEGNESQPKTISAPDADAVAPMIDVPDNSVSAPLITVPNPVCLLPPESELVDVSQDEHDEIFRVLALGGSVLVPGKKGRPSTGPAPGPTVEDLKNRERAIRDRVLLLTDPLIARHRDEVEAERPTTLTAEQYKQLQGYRQDLRDWPESGHFPAIEYRPEQPAWLAELIQ